METKHYSRAFGSPLFPPLPRGVFQVSLVSGPLFAGVCFQLFRGMHQKHSRSQKLALEAESEAQELQLQCLQVKQGTELQTTSLGQRLELVERLREEITQWQSHVASLETLLTQRKET